MAFLSCDPLDFGDGRQPPERFSSSQRMLGSNKPSHVDRIVLLLLGEFHGIRIFQVSLSEVAKIPLNLPSLGSWKRDSWGLGSGTAVAAPNVPPDSDAQDATPVAREVHPCHQRQLTGNRVAIVTLF